MNATELNSPKPIWRHRFTALIMWALVILAVCNIYHFYNVTSHLTDSSPVFELRELKDLRLAQQRLAHLPRHIPSSEVGYINIQLLNDQSLNESWLESVQYVFSPILIFPDPQAQQPWLIADFPDDQLLNKFVKLTRRKLIASTQKGLAILGPPDMASMQKQQGDQP